MILYMLSSLLAFFPGQDKPPAAKAITPEEAVQKMRAALQQHDLKELAQWIVPPHDVTLAALAKPFAEARAASERFDKAVREHLKVPYVHPFAASLAPFADRHLELIEIAKDGTQVLARVRYGPPGRAREETLGIYPQDGSYRLDLPADIARMVRNLARPSPATDDKPAPTRLQREQQRLEKVALILDTLAKEITPAENAATGRWTTKEAVTLRLLELVQETKLTEGMGE